MQVASIIWIIGIPYSWEQLFTHIEAVCCSMLTDGQADPHDSPITVFRFNKHLIQTSIVAAGGQKLKLCTEVSFGHSGE